MWLAVGAMAQSCLIQGSTAACVNQSIEYSVGVYAGQSNFAAQWTVNNQSVSSDPSYLAYTFTTSGTFTISYFYSYETCGLVWDNDSGSNVYQCNPFSDGCTISVNVVAGFATPVPTANPPVLCQPGSVTLTVSNPQAGVSYSWTSTGSYSGSGTQVVFNNVAQRTEFTVRGSNAQCSLSNTIAVEVEKTDITPIIVNSADYHKAKLGISTWWPSFVFVPNHYWQSTSSGQVLTDENRVQTEYIVTEPGTYFIRKYLGQLNCWTQATGPVTVALNYRPSPLFVVAVPNFGYASSYVTNEDKSHLFLFAEYYLVSSMTGTETSKRYTEGQAFLVEGEYFIRGRDKETGTWGDAYQFSVVFRSDGFLNTIHTKSFDGTPANNILSESKSYFDQRGQSLQSQTKTFHNNLPVVFASQSLKDKYDRTVGGTLSAPILENDFRYKAAFALNDVGKPLSYTDFEKAVPLSTDQKGTLGNYYSSQNQWNEQKAPTAKRLFSRTDFYEDGTGEERKSAQPGDTHFIGSGREVLKGTFPVGNSNAPGEDNELTDYLNKRAIIFGGSALKKIEGVQTVVRDENERFVVSITDKSGKVLMTARKGTKLTDDFPSSISSDKMSYFYVLGAPNATTQSVTINGTSDYVLENTISNTTVPKLTSPLPHIYNLQAGYYRVLPTAGTVKVSYTNYFTDIAYQFYNDAGRLVVSVSPNGYEQWTREVDPVPYADIDKSTHTYNHQGWLLSMTEKDAGTTNYLYRRDGKIRFSQNAEQLLNKKYSYTNYDDLGRPIESGESSYQTANFNDLKVNLESIGSDWMGQSPVKKDWVQTGYDFPVTTPDFSPIPGFAQTYVRGAVSFTKNANTKTWYSYDELGRVVWMAQQPTTFPYAFVTQYVYDFLGNVLTTSTKAYSGSTSRDAFFHHYEYDKNKRLEKVSTSLDGNKKTVQAEYFYYLHGPLKRVVLATNLQGIDFVYNIHGWLTQINHPDTNMDPGNDGGSGSSVRKDVFGMILEYYERTMIPTTASLDPNQFHKIKIPNAQDAAIVQTAVLMDPIELYRASMRHGIEELRNINRSAVTSSGSGGGQ